MAAFAGDGPTLASVGDNKITVAEFEKFISSYPEDRRKFLAENPRNKEALLIRMVHVKVLSNVARQRGLDKDERIRQQIDYNAEEILAQELLRQVAADINITEDELRSYYKVNEKSFSVPETVKARHILVGTQENVSAADEETARKKAEGILKRVRSGEDFARLAEEFSDDPDSKKKGGDLGFFGRGSMVKPFEDAAFSMKPGDVSGIIRTNFGFHIIKVEEKKEASIEPFDTAKDRLRPRLRELLSQEKSKDLLDNAMKDAKVEMHSELLTNEKK
jgi:peptidyl-prolyl cis-trans isomerase C